MDSSERSAKILARKAEFVASCRKLMDKHGLCDWKVEIGDWAEERKGAAGSAAYCLYTEKLIKLGYVELLLLPNDRARRNLYLHEIAHALVFVRHGDPVVREVRRTKHWPWNSWIEFQADGRRVRVIDVERRLIPSHGRIWRDIAYSIGVRDASYHHYGLAGRHKRAMAARKARRYRTS